MPTRYLSSSEVAERIGVVPGALGRYKLPEPDVLVGRARGWLPETIDEWQRNRPGRGNWKETGNHPGRGRKTGE